MTTPYKEKLVKDIYDCVQANGPITANEIAMELNGKYLGSLNGQRVSQYLRQLRGRGCVQMSKEEMGEPGLWSVVA